MRVLVLGSGAREHALVRALATDTSVTALIAAPGNPGMAASGGRLPVELVDVDLTDTDDIVACAKKTSADLVVVGPEAPLVGGAADALGDAGIACCGPSARAARLEGSKSFAKDVMATAGVPTAESQTCSTIDQVAKALDQFGAPHVVKADGLAGGKGVVVTDDRREALAHAESCLAGGHGQVIVEEFLDGPEFSVFCLCDGQTVVALAPAQDYKRALDAGRGPNTGGMGAYAPLPWAPAGLAEQVRTDIAEPVVAEMARREAPFRGVLYCGLALTSRGPRVIEFNVRFGDPDGNVSLALLETPLAGLLDACAKGTLAECGPLSWRDGAAVTVVLAAAGYPSGPRTGDPVTGDLADREHSYVLQAGVKVAGEGLVSSGGRVLGVVGLGADVGQARDRAYAHLADITLEGGHFRKDIAALP